MTVNRFDIVKSLRLLRDRCEVCRRHENEADYRITVEQEAKKVIDELGLHDNIVAIEILKSICYM